MQTQVLSPQMVCSHGAQSIGLAWSKSYVRCQASWECGKGPKLPGPLAQGTEGVSQQVLALCQALQAQGLPVQPQPADGQAIIAGWSQVSQFDSPIHMAQGSEEGRITHCCKLGIPCPGSMGGGWKVEVRLNLLLAKGDSREGNSLLLATEQP